MRDDWCWGLVVEWFGWTDNFACVCMMGGGGSPVVALFPLLHAILILFYTVCHAPFSFFSSRWINPSSFSFSLVMASVQFDVISFCDVILTHQ